MRGAIPPLHQYAFMALCSAKKKKSQGLYPETSCIISEGGCALKKLQNKQNYIYQVKFNHVEKVQSELVPVPNTM
jgi:hypothetical protein